MTIELERTPEKAIREQKAELERLQALPVLERDAMKRVDAESPLAQAVVGMRRAGKSVVCRRALKNAGIPFGYVDFDDETLAKIPSDKLDAILQIVREVYGDVSHFLFDEIQNIEGWHLFVNRLLRNGNHVVITGSNARLLTSDLATHLTGRHIPIEIFPFSYFEYCEWLGRDTAETWKNYFFNGGLPETFSMQDLRGYVAALYNSILSRDILGRHKVRNAQRFMDAAYVIMQQYAREVSYDRLAEKAGVSSAHTMQTYVGYLAESYLVFLLRKYSTKPAERIRNEKIYVADPSFISYFMGVLGSEEELGWRLENIVYLELLRRFGEVYVGQLGSREVDFVTFDNGIPSYWQIALSVRDPDVLGRELAPLSSIRDHYRKTILTLDLDPVADYDGILVKPVLPFLLNEE